MNIECLLKKPKIVSQWQIIHTPYRVPSTLSATAATASWWINRCLCSHHAANFTRIYQKTTSHNTQRQTHKTQQNSDTTPIQRTNTCIGGKLSHRMTWHLSIHIHAFKPHKNNINNIGHRSVFTLWFVACCCSLTTGISSPESLCANHIDVITTCLDLVLSTRRNSFWDNQ